VFRVGLPLLAADRGTDLVLKITVTNATPIRLQEGAWGRRLRLLTLLALVLTVVSATMGTPTFAQEANEERKIETKFEQGDESYPAQISLDRVAIVVTEQALADDEVYNRIVAAFEGEPISGLSANIIGVKTSDATDLASLKQFINEKLASNSDFQRYISDAGLVLTIAKSEHPWILTDKIIVQIAEHSEPDLINAIAEKYDAKVVTKNTFDPRNFVIEAPAVDTLQVSNAINKHQDVSFAHPNFYRGGEWRQASVIPNDEFFRFQWNLHNGGGALGTEDADIDADKAWSFGAGSSDTIVAVIDSGFETVHPDLADAFWTNASEANGLDNYDDDKNGYVDDVHGWNFVACPYVHPKGRICGNNDVNPPAGLIKEPHGTAVAGAALARAYNGPLLYNHHEGIVGVCPNCKLLPVRFSLGQPVNTHRLSIDYAQSMGADVINISWGYRRGEPILLDTETAINNAATDGRGGLGAVVAISMTNESYNNCEHSPPDSPGPPDFPDLSSLPTAIAVAGSTNEDQVSVGGYGKCLDVLAPTDGGTLRTVTTDVKGWEGYNFARQRPGCVNPAQNRAYTFCFGGLSFSAPQVAGVAGLILSLDDWLTRDQVQRLLQDTSDKISDSVGEYSRERAHSSPGDGSQPKLGYGRINAFEAVQIVADRFNGRGGVDVFIRDNRLDWGNTEQPSSVTFERIRGFIPYWQSVDIKVDAPPFRTAPPENAEESACPGLDPDAQESQGRFAPPATSIEFGCFAHEEPMPETDNKVYVRVHNRGVKPATNVRVKLHWAVHDGANAPALPADFWSAFTSNSDAGDTSTWHPLPSQTIPSLPYSGASVAGGRYDGSSILTFEFHAPVFQQAQANADHFSLLAVVDSPDDPLSVATVLSRDPGVVTPRDNSVTLLTIPLGNSIAGNILESDGETQQNANGYTVPLR
jgi:subtilisin family serine protease